VTRKTILSFTTILILCNLATFILTILTIIHTRRLWRLRSIRWLIALSVTFLIGSACLANLYIAQDYEQKVLFLHMRVWGMAFLAPCWLYFMSSVFEVWNWLHKKWVIFVMFTPSVMNLVLIVHPSTRHLLFTNFQPISYLGVSSARFEFGSWYTPFFIWAMLQMVSSYVISGIAFVRNKGHHRTQVIILNLGLTFSLIQSVVAHIFSNALELEFIVTNTFPLLGTAIGVMWALIYHRLLSIVPLAMLRIFEQFPDPVFVLDDENRVMGVSNKGVEVFNLPGDFLGQRFDSILPSVNLLPGEVVLKGHHFYVALEKIGKEENSHSGTIVFFRDISTQKIIESRLIEGIDLRTRLLALMAHDLSGFVDTQAMISQNLQKQMSSAHSHHFDHLESLSLASQSLISNVMNWTKNESINFNIVRKSFEWSTLIRDVIEQVQGRLDVKEIEVVFDHPAGFILTNGDSEMMASVLRNILFNAIRASASKKKIYVSLSQTSLAIEIKVRDEGDGIDPVELERILEGSKRFIVTGVSKTNGSGIGLMLSRYFISLHGGSFSMESKLSAGTEVLFSVPL
jgi:signal transduction histidine kinase